MSSGNVNFQTASNKDFKIDGDDTPQRMTFVVSENPTSQTAQVAASIQLSADGFQASEVFQIDLSDKTGGQPWALSDAYVDKGRLIIKGTVSGGTAQRFEKVVGLKDVLPSLAEYGISNAIRDQSLDHQIAQSAGVLGALAMDGSVDSMLDSIGVTPGMISIEGMVGHADLPRLGHGLLSRPESLSGGGTAEGLGGLGTQGRVSGSDYGVGALSFGSKGEGSIGTVGNENSYMGIKGWNGEVKTVVRGEPANARPGLDPIFVEAVVRRHYNAIRHCYQRELTKDPSLAGRLEVQFTIAPDGSVLSARVVNASFSNAAAGEKVGQDVMKVIEKFKFPEPHGHGIVVVNYPFDFAAE